MKVEENITFIPLLEQGVGFTYVIVCFFFNWCLACAMIMISSFLSLI